MQRNKLHFLKHLIFKNIFSFLLFVYEDLPLQTAGPLPENEKLESLPLFCVWPASVQRVIKKIISGGVLIITKLCNLRNVSALKSLVKLHHEAVCVPGPSSPVTRWMYTW